MNAIKKKKFVMQEETTPTLAQEIVMIPYHGEEKPEDLSPVITSKTPEVSTETQKEVDVLLADLHDAQIRDILRRPKLFFTTSNALEEALMLLVMMRINFQRKYDLKSFRENWIKQELIWLSPASSLHETLNATAINDVDFHAYLFSKMIKDFDPTIFAWREL